MFKLNMILFRLKPKTFTWVGCNPIRPNVCICNTRVGKPHCSSDGVVYPNKFALDCLGNISLFAKHKIFDIYS